MQQSATIRVGLVDHEDVVRLGLRTLIEREPDLRLTRECATGEEARRLIPGQVDVAVIADPLPDVYAITLCRELQSLSAMHVIMLASRWTEASLVASFEAGASACLPIDARAEGIVEGIRTAKAGGLMMGAGFDRILNPARTAESRDPIDSLTPSERNVLALVATGRTNREIGAALYLSEKTVKNYVSRILSKLSCGRRAEAASHFTRYQMAHGATSSLNGTSG